VEHLSASFRWFLLVVLRYICLHHIDDSRCISAPLSTLGAHKLSRHDLLLSSALSSADENARELIREHHCVWRDDALRARTFSMPDEWCCDGGLGARASRIHLQTIRCMAFVPQDAFATGRKTTRLPFERARFPLVESRLSSTLSVAGEH
jgi:hypothetical protein